MRARSVLHYRHQDFGLHHAQPFRLRTTCWDTPNEGSVAIDKPVVPPLDHENVVLYQSHEGTVNPVDLHLHDIWELIIVHDSHGGLLLTEDGEQPLSRGDVLFLAPNLVHGFQQSPGLSKSIFLFLPHWFCAGLRFMWKEEGLMRQLLLHCLLHSGRSGIWQLQIPEENVRDCEHEVRQMAAEGSRENPSYSLLYGCFLKILSIINGAFLRKNQHRMFDLSAGIWDIVTFIEHAIEQGDELRLDNFAETAGVCRRQLERKFKSETGITVSNYYRNRRLQHAERMLLEPNCSVKEVAYRLNFCDPAHFVRVFKESTGLTPGDYRDKHLAPNALGHDESALPEISRCWTGPPRRACDGSACSATDCPYHAGLHAPS